MSTEVPHPDRPLPISFIPAPGSVVDAVPSDDPFSVTLKVPVVRMPVDQITDQPQPVTAAPTPPSAPTNHLPALESLPDDPVILKGMILELLATLAETRHEREHLQERLNLLIKRVYGEKTERFNPDQGLLFADVNQPGEPPTNDAGTDVSSTPPKKNRHNHGRKPLPKNLRREPVHYRLTEAELCCSVCGTQRVEVGTETTSQLDYQPASVFIRDHIEHKYACPCCAKKGEAQFIAASKPEQPLGKGSPGAGLLAHIIVTKYFDHMPLYRQEPMFQRQGLDLSRSTTCDWMAACAQRLQPLYEVMKAEVLQSETMWTDDTPVKLQGGEPDATKKSRLWVYRGDQRHPYIVFEFTPNRKRDGPQTFLKNYRGYLQADAFSGYDALYVPVDDNGQPHVKEVACNSHARRKFYEARGSDEVLAHQVLAYYNQLYEIERRAKNVTDAVRLQMRKDLAVPILDKLHAWLEQQQPQVLPKSRIAEAINYALNQWKALCRYTEAGFLTIDNNVAEREMKQIAIGRKNWLFFGSPQGGHTAATLYSFTSTCRRLGVEPWAYLKDVLTRLPTTPPERLAELLPDRWLAEQPQAKT